MKVKDSFFLSMTCRNESEEELEGETGYEMGGDGMEESRDTEGIMMMTNV